MDLTMNWNRVRFWMVALYLAGLVTGIWFAREVGPQWPLAFWLTVPPTACIVVAERQRRKAIVRPRLPWRVRLHFSLLVALATLVFAFAMFLGEWRPSYLAIVGSLGATALLACCVVKFWRDRRSGDYRTRLWALTLLFFLWIGFMALVAARFWSGDFHF